MNPNALKYKIWTKEKMSEVTTHSEEGELLPFVGVSDRNGQECYLGDIIKDTTIDVYYVVEWNDYESGYLLMPAGSAALKFSRLIGNVRDYIIVGNIYENPHILKDITLPHTKKKLLRCYMCGKNAETHCEIISFLHNRKYHLCINCIQKVVESLPLHRSKHEDIPQDKHHIQA